LIQSIDYPILKGNLKALGKNYFENFPSGNFKELTKQLKVSNIKLKEIESSLSKLYSIDADFWEYHFDNKKVRLTQSNLIQYAIESFIDLNWDNTDKSDDRIIVIAAIRSQLGVYKPDIESKFYEKNRYQDVSYDQGDDYYGTAGLGRDHPKYDDDLDFDQQDPDVYC
jgi:hypothetical protein